MATNVSKDASVVIIKVSISRLVLDNEDEDSTILQYFGNSVPVNTVQHTRKIESSMSPLS